MNNKTDMIGTGMLFVMVVTLILPWRIVGASWSDPIGGEAIPPLAIELAVGVHPERVLPTGQMKLAGDEVTSTQDRGPYPYPVPHPELQIPLDETIHPDRPAGTCWVSNTGDSGPNTLRQCLLDAIAGGNILFNPVSFPPGTPATINLGSELPTILVDNLTIDASEAGVILDGSALPGDSLGLVIDNVQGVALRGLQIQGFSRGVVMGWGATNNTVGGDRGIGAGPLGQGNLISDNTNTGVQLQDVGTNNNSIVGNYIGTDIAGNGAHGNAAAGIAIVSGASQNVIGGTGAGNGNLISGNSNFGIWISDIGTSGNRVLGNTIGADMTGEFALPNAAYGVFIGFGASNSAIGGGEPGTGNLISGNGISGVFIQDESSVGNQIQGNRIGTNEAGVSPVPNNNGVVVIAARGTIIGGADTSTPWICDGPCNLVSGNDRFGIVIQSVSPSTSGLTSLGSTGRPLLDDPPNQVLGNFIGTDLTGTSAIPNMDSGVDLSYEAVGNLVGGRCTLGDGNLISGNRFDGIVVRHPLTRDNQISGNRIGTTADGGAALPNGNNGIWISEGASGNTIGGDGAELGNQISGQATDEHYFGVLISTESEPEANGNQVIGNRIGTNVGGTSDIPNGGGVGLWGLVTGTMIRDNIISGNALRGIWFLESTGNEVRDNKIGVAANGLSPLPNDVVGIILDTAPDNMLGPGNTIAYNYDGIRIGKPESVGVTITQNSIFANTDEQIDFFDVQQPLAPAPNLTGWDGDTNTVSGTTCGGCLVEVFNNWHPGPAGRTYLGTTSAAGDGRFSLALGPGYRYLTTTATDAAGTTSKFSNSLFIGTYSYIYLPLTGKNGDH